MNGSVSFSVVFENGRWSLHQDGALKASFDSAAAAERRGRWLAARATVQGLESQLDIHDRLGCWLGVWRNEALEPALAITTALAA